MVSWVFGWTSGRELVETSYKDAKVRSREIRDQHRRKAAEPPSPT